MNAIQSYDFEGSQLRAEMIEGEPWFVALDVCAALDIKNPRDAVQKLDEDEKGVGLTDTPGGKQPTLIVNESGLYALILRSRDAMKAGTPQHRFRKWVTSEVLPTVRRTGAYSLTEADPAKRLTAAIRAVETARRVFGKSAAREVWDNLGLPKITHADILPASDDPLFAPMRDWLSTLTEATIDDALMAMNLPPDADPQLRRRLGRVMRELCWIATAERRGERVVKVFRPIAQEG